MRKIVVKLGTRTLTTGQNRLDRRNIQETVRQMCELAQRGVKVILVTSGAIASGMGLLGLKKKPSVLAALQAAAAIGQNRLMDIYSEFFGAGGYATGQMLLTQEDFNDRKRYLNIKYTLRELLKFNAVPIINENDTVSTEEIRCGDNDRLSSLVADLAEADMLIILTDVDGLMDENGGVVSLVEDIDSRIAKMVKASRCDISRGGMATKLEAARRATEAGIDCVVANGRTKDVILKVVDGQKVGTFFRARGMGLAARKRWIAFSSKTKGAVIVDSGAREALVERSKSLLASGIVGVQGRFKAKDTVSILDESNNEFARGVAGYSSEEIGIIKGMRSSDLAKALGRKAKDEVIHKDNLVIL